MVDGLWWTLMCERKVCSPVTVPAAYLLSGSLDLLVHNFPAFELLAYDQVAKPFATAHESS